MRYYNENPQVTYLLEKIKGLEKQIKEYRGLLALSYAKMEEYEEIYKELRGITKEAQSISNSFKDKVDGYRHCMKHFDSLPWYKKMFYKFGV